MSSSLSLWVKLALELEAQQILDQVTFLAIRESQVHASVVVIDHGVQISKPSVVIEATLEVHNTEVCPECPVCPAPRHTLLIPTVQKARSSEGLWAQCRWWPPLLELHNSATLAG